MTYPDRSELLTSINSFMIAYNEREDALARAQARKRQEPDADGFVTVTRGSKSNPAARKEEVQKQLEKQKDKQKAYGDFYRFQGREKRKQREMELRKQFAEDQTRLQKMREDRGRYQVSHIVLLSAKWSND